MIKDVNMMFKFCDKCRNYDYYLNDYDIEQFKKLHKYLKDILDVLIKKEHEKVEKESLKRLTKTREEEMKRFEDSKIQTYIIN